MLVGRFSRSQKHAVLVLTMLALFLSYSLVRNLCSLSASARRMLCCSRARRRFRSVKESGLETLRRGVIGACVSRAMARSRVPGDSRFRRILGCVLYVVVGAAQCCRCCCPSAAMWPVICCYAVIGRCKCKLRGARVKLRSSRYWWGSPRSTGRLCA